jgi:hypothetical protein
MGDYDPYPYYLSPNLETYEVRIALPYSIQQAVIANVSVPWATGVSPIVIV